MSLRLTVALLILCNLNMYGQRLELINRNETSYQTQLSEVLRIPLQIKNTTDKAQFYIIRKVQGDLGGTQKGYFCLDSKCLEPEMDEFSKKIEPGQTISGLYYTLETGLVTGQTNFSFEIFERGHLAEALEYNVSISVEERKEKSMAFQSKDIVIHDVYPNPVSDYAFIEYRLLNDAIKANVVIHNILGMPMGDYELPASETSVKLSMDALAPGVYFYTLYLDNDGVLTRKLIVRK
ncbi:MAG: T9SS type A sorting domain-containing protein [Cyclobacteriaceae bacterium]|nr:T9SS type A sorting domain-containing protein [Cyclobacteriaceae bacterium]